MTNVHLFFKILLSINWLVSASNITQNNCKRLSLTFDSNNDDGLGDDVVKASFKDIHTALNSLSGNTSTSIDSKSYSDDSRSHYSFMERCSKLSNEIKDFGMEQLGLKGHRSEFNFTEYQITNWPIFVPLRFIYWDEQAFVDLSAAMPFMEFVKKSNFESLTPSKYYTIERAKNRRLILSMFLESFRLQIKNEKARKIDWSWYHLKGWPRNVRLLPDSWSTSEMLVLYRNLKNIKFEPIASGQARIITYDDEDMENIDFKRKFDAEEADNENKSGDLISSAKSSSSSNHQNSSESNGKSLSPRLPRIYNLDESDSHSSFRASCLNLSNEIKVFAMNQLGMEGNPSQINLLEYDIKNWPMFVPLNYIDWDEQALVDLRGALPSMVFTVKPDANLLTPSVHSAKELLKNRHLIYDMLLESLKKQIKNFKIKKIVWIYYHLKGWPRNVKFRSSNWSCTEISTLYRNLENIQFVPVLLGERRTITYTDGEVEITKNRKRKFISDLFESDNDDLMAEDITSGASSASIDCNYITTGSSSSAILESDDLMDLGIIRDDDGKEPCIFEQFYINSLDNYEKDDESDSSRDPAIKVSPYSEIKDVEKFIEEELENYNPNLDEF